MAIARREEFVELLQRHGAALGRVRGSRGVIPCLFHDDRHPSLSIDLDRGLFHCFSCSAQGGVRRLAELVGERKGTRPIARSRRPELEDSWHGLWMWPLADLVRQRSRAARSLRAHATRLGSDAPGIWPMLAHAARVDCDAAIAEAGLDAILAEGRLP